MTAVEESRTGVAKRATQKTVAQKLQMKPGDAVSITGDTPERRALLGGLPEGSSVVAVGEAAVAVTFGWRPNSNVAVDDTWSAVRVRPLADGEAPLG